MIPKEILKKVRRIEIRTKHLVNSVFSGEYHSVFKGRGMEFAEVRNYQYGDDIRSIDWNVTARMSSPFVKRFSEERELTVMLAVDASSSGAFGTVDQMKGEVAVELCALLAFSAIKNNDRVGLLIFTDRVEKYIPPKKGRKHVLRVIRELLYFKPQAVKTDVKGALETLDRVLRRRAVVFLVSDFITEDFSRPLRVLGRKHDAIAVTVHDPRERELPPIGLIELQDAETGESILVDTSDPGFCEEFAGSWTEERRLLESTFRKAGVDWIDVPTDRPYVDALMGFFRKRAKRT